MMIFIQTFVVHVVATITNQHDNFNYTCICLALKNFSGLTNHVYDPK
jgi:hypothetical protein